jgi:hypothetical protein
MLGLALANGAVYLRKIIAAWGYWGRDPAVKQRILEYNEDDWRRPECSSTGSGTWRSEGRCRVGRAFAPEHALMEARKAAFVGLYRLYKHS